MTSWNQTTERLVAGGSIPKQIRRLTVTGASRLTPEPYSRAADTGAGNPSTTIGRWIMKTMETSRRTKERIHHHVRILFDPDQSKALRAERFLIRYGSRALQPLTYACSHESPVVAIDSSNTARSFG